MPKLSVDQLFLKAKLYEKKGHNREAQKLYELILEAYPKNIRAKDNLYALNKQMLSNTNQKIPEEKIKQLVNLYNQGKLSILLEQAIVLVKQYQNDFIIWNLLGAANKGLGKIFEASNCFRTVTKLNPYVADGHNNLGVTLQEQGKLDDAIKSFNKAVSLKPNYPEAYNNIGITYHEQGKLEESIEVYKKVISLKPNYPEVYYNMGNILQEQGKLEEAIEAYNKAVSFKPNYEKAQAQKLFQKAKICDWGTIKKDKNLISKLGKSNNYIFPFSVLSLEDTPKEHRLRSELYARIMYSHKKKIAATNQPLLKKKRLRIGYFSADFHNHATMYLISKIFEEHNKEKFEIYAYSYGPSKKNDEMRQKLIKSVDFFKNVRKMNDKDIALLARQDKIDIAVDLKGYTRDARTGIFAYRAAPIQINYLGYPGTMGADFIDYIIADSVVIPDNQRHSYSEKIIYLPHAYQPNDNTRLISKKVITKNDMNLPNEGFIFCCFNNNYKITPTEFDIWMRLLIKIEGSVLWLIRSNKWAEINLCKEAEKRGVSKERLIFSIDLK